MLLSVLRSFFRTAFLLSLSFFFLFGEVDAQTSQEGKEADGEERIEVRKLRFDEEGTPIQGSLSDSLRAHYYIDEEGKVFKYFRIYEKALAHYLNGYYPRKRKDVEDGVVYIQGAPNWEKGFPDHIELK